MKAKIRKTGEIVDVICFNNCSTIRNSLDYVSYIDPKGVEHDREMLNFYWDFEPIETTTNEHWQDVRERAAIAAMQGLLSNARKTGSGKEYVEAAIEYANTLVEELKKK
jgi:hypothetical protein